jgi:hypothetical protein
VGAPAFRSLDRRVELDTFTDRLREGLMSDHPDMPTFRFSREDARALVAYLQVYSGAVSACSIDPTHGRWKALRSQISPQISSTDCHC